MLAKKRVCRSNVSIALSNYSSSIMPGMEQVMIRLSLSRKMQAVKPLFSPGSDLALIQTSSVQKLNNWGDVVLCPGKCVLPPSSTTILQSHNLPARAAHAYLF